MRASPFNAKLWSLVALFCVVAVGTCGFLLYRLSASARTYDRLFDREIRDQTSARVLQVGFKKQVQEWKDVLLRGHDPADLTAYTAQFQAEDRHVNEMAVALRNSAEDPAVRALVGQFIEAHDKLDENYAGALARFNADGHDPFEADRMVRGQDRPPTDLLDRIAGLMSEHTGNQVKAQNAAASRSLVALLAAIALLLLVAVHRVNRANQARARSEDRYRTLIENSPDAILAVDLNEVILMCNRRAAELHGYQSPDDLAGIPLDRLFAERRRQALPTMANGEYRLCRKDGSIFPGELTVAPLQNAQGRATGSMVIARDITERRQAEQTRAILENQLQQVRQLESVGRLAGGVAHDFNNLLTVINGYSDMILRETPEGTETRRRIAQVRKAGTRAAELTSQLLAFGRKQRIEPVAMDLNSVVREVEDMLRRLLPENIDVTTHLDPSLGQIKADPGRIHQVLVNLIVNARDAMPAGGRLTLETMNVDLDAEYAASHAEVTAGPSVLVQITDTGVGMDEDVRAHIFEPFFTTKKEGMGTGLGLASTYGIVRQSGGWIWVYSEPGRGTSFKVYFPRVYLPHTEAAVSREPATVSLEVNTSGAETILVVEDRDDVRSLAREVLEGYGYRVIEAANGSTALAIASKHEGTIGLLLTDVVMPGMNGKELAEQLMQIRPGIKVLFMSGYSENVIFHDGVLKAGIAHIAKPLMPEALAAKVRATIGTH